VNEDIVKNQDDKKEDENNKKIKQEEIVNNQDDKKQDDNKNREEEIVNNQDDKKDEDNNKIKENEIVNDEEKKIEEINQDDKKEEREEKEGDKVFVWVLDKNQINKRLIELDGRDTRTGNWAIKTGLNSGEKILRKDSSALRNGQAFTLRTESPAKVGE
jgi:hypothetical protein